MTSRLPPIAKELDPPLPRSVAEAVDRLLATLSQEEKAEIAGTAEEDLVDLHFGLGSRIREDFRLWHDGNRALLRDCQRVESKPIHPDDASMVIIRALWARLRH